VLSQQLSGAAVVLRWSAYIHPRLVYAAFVVAEEIWGGGLAKNDFQKTTYQF